MKKTVSLKENHEFRRLYHRGVSTAGKHVVIYCRRNKLGYNRLGLTVSAKLACAVKRNRIKRLFREAYRLNEDKFADGIDLVLPVYPDLLAVRDRGHREIRRDQGRLAGV